MSPPTFPPKSTHPSPSQTPLTPKESSPLESSHQPPIIAPPITHTPRYTKHPSHTYARIKSTTPNLPSPPLSAHTSDTHTSKALEPSPLAQRTLFYDDKKGEKDEPATEQKDRVTQSEEISPDATLSQILPQIHELAEGIQLSMEEYVQIEDLTHEEPSPSNIPPSDASIVLERLVPIDASTKEDMSMVMVLYQEP